MIIFPFLNKKLQISSLEEGAFYTAFFARFFYQIGVVLAWTILLSLFIEQFGIRSLPLLFAFEALMFLLGSFFSSFLLSRVSLFAYLSTLLAGTLISLLFAFCFFSQPLVFFAFFIFAKSFFFFQVNLGLFRRTEELFTSASALRLLPKLESSVTFGAVVGALLTLALLEFVSIPFVLLGWVLACVGIFIILLRTPQWLHLIPKIPSSAHAHDISAFPLKHAFRAFLRYPFLRVMTMLLFFQGAFFVFTEIQFLRYVSSYITHSEPVSFYLSNLQASTLFDVFSHAQQTVSHGTMVLIDHVSEGVHVISSRVFMHKSLAHDLGVFHLFFALFALFLQLILTPRLLSFLGVIGTFIFSCFISLVSFFAYFFGISSVNWMRAFQHGTHSLSESPFHLSFYSFPHHSREPIRLFLEGICRPLGILFSVALLYFVPFEYLLFVFLGFALFVFGVSFFLRSGYTKLTVDHLSCEENIEAKLNAITLLGHRGHKNAARFLVLDLLKPQKSEVIREKIVWTLHGLKDPQIIHAYLHILANPDELLFLKQVILESLAKFEISEDFWKHNVFARHHFLEWLQRSFEEATDSYTKKLLVMNVFQHLSPEMVVPFFLKTLDSADDALKSVYLRSCRVFSDPEIVHYVRDYLYHDSPRLRTHAVIALWNFFPQDELRMVLDELFVEGSSDSLVSVLYAIGEVRDPERKDVLFANVTHEHLDVRLHAFVALAKLGDKASISGLLEFIFSEDRDLSRKVFYMLHRVDEDMRQYIQREIQRMISHRVALILQSSSDSLKNHTDMLRHYYWMSGHYDDLVALDSLS